MISMAKVNAGKCLRQEQAHSLLSVLTNRPSTLLPKTCKQMRRMRISLGVVFSTSGRSIGAAHPACSVGNHGAPSTDQHKGSKGTKYPEKTRVMPSKYESLSLVLLPLVPLLLLSEFPLLLCSVPCTLSTTRIRQ